MSDSNNIVDEYKFIQISENPIERRSNIFTLPIETPVIIITEKGEEKKSIKYIKKGNSVKFIDNNGKEYTYNNIYFELTNIENTGCFSGDSKVKILNKKGEPIIVEVKKLFSGNKIRASDNSYYTINYKVQIYPSCNMFRMYECNGLLITAYHPVKIDSKWIFPIDNPLIFKLSTSVNCVYSLALEGGKNPLINDIEVIGLGHGIKNDPVASHSFFGTNAVIDSIHKESINGICILFDSQFVRDSSTKQVVGINKLY